MPRRIARLALIVAFVIVRPTASAAHAGLRLSDPIEGVTLGDSPSIIRLSFSEAPEPALSSVRVLDPSGGAHQLGSARRAPDDVLSLLVNVRPLERGVYIVSWRTVSAQDGHVSTGAYAFGVRMPVTGKPPAATAAPPTSALELLARIIIIAGLMGLLGSTGSTLGGVRSTSSGRLAVIASLGALVGVVCLAFAQRAAAGTTFTQLAHTTVGAALVLRLVAGSVAAFAAALAITQRTPLAQSVSTVVAFVAALVMVVVHVSAGHAASRTSLEGTADIAIQAAHFGAAGIWVGGLAALLLAVRGSASPSNAAAIRRFSTLAAIVFFAVLGTGLVRAVEALDSWEELATTSYGRILAVKSALFVAAAACAALNRWRNVPAAPRTLRPFRVTSGWELAILAGAGLAAAALTASPPPSAERASFALSADGHDFATTVRARLAAASDQPGANRFVVRLSDYDTGTPIRDARVSLRFAPLDDPGTEPTSLALAANSGDFYVGTGANMSFDGRWQVVVLVERAGNSVQIPLELETQVAPRSMTVQRTPGQSTAYTIEILRAGVIRFQAEPERPGPARLYVSCFDFIGDPRAVDSITVTIASRATGGRAIQAPVRAVDRGRFAADVTLATGINTIAAVAHTPDGTRIRAKTAIDISR